MTSSSDRPDEEAGVTPSTENPYGLSLLALASVALRYRRTIAGSALLLAGLVTIWTLAKPRAWTSSSAFIAQSKRSQRNLSGLAGQFGLALPLSGSEESPSFYADLLMGRTILGEIVMGRYAGPDSSRTMAFRTMAFADVFAIENPDSALRRDLAIRKLEGMVSISIVQRTGVIRVGVTTRYPLASTQINRRLLELLNTFNLETRQSQALAERRFTEQRTTEALAELRRAEDRLQAFLAGNRDITGSPRLQFEQDRLAREVAMRQSIYTALAQALEQARIDEVRDTPALTVLEQPERPVRPDSRAVVAKFALAAITGALIGLLLAAVDAYLEASRKADPATYARFASLWAEVKRDLRHPRELWGRRRTAR